MSYKAAMIEIGKIEDNPWNGNRTADADLVASVEEHGVLQNIVVRPLDAGGFQVVCGARRLDAARRAGLKNVPCQLRMIDEKEARALTIVENMQREAMHPVAEAAAITALLESGLDKAEVAARLGKSEAFVTRRVKLSGLSPKLIEEAGESIGRVSVRVLELLSTLPHARQEELTENDVLASIDPQDLAMELANQSSIITNAPFDCSDDTLLPAAGACSCCPKRTGAEPTLFDDMDGIKDGDRCLDDECFKAKEKAHMERKRAELIQAHGEKLLLLTEYMPYSGPNHDELKALGAVEVGYDVGDAEICKKKDHGARPALMVFGRAVGKVCWARIRKPAALAKGARTDRGGEEESGVDLEETPEAKAQYSLRARKLKLWQRRLAWIAEALKERLPGGDHEQMPDEKYLNPVSMCWMAAAFGGFSDRLEDGLEFWGSRTPDTAPRDVFLRIWRGAAHALVNYLQVIRVGDLDDEFEGKCDVVAEIMGQDMEALWAAAEIEIPTPKSLEG